MKGAENDVEEPPGEMEEPPGERAALWPEVSDQQWNDWRWQLSHRLNTLEELRQVIRLTPEEEAGITARHRFRLDITPYFASLMDPYDPRCPIRRQVIPTAHELEPFESAMADSLNEDRHSPVPGLVHRYPDRVLMLVTTQCASYCRYCTRSRMVGDPTAQFSRTDYDQQIDYIARTPQVRDVLLSGGDPLILPQRILEQLLRRLRAIPHVEIIRIGTRVPVFLPMRIDEELTAMLRRFHPLWMNIHFNHPREITPEVRRACEMLADAGIPLGSQTVLLAGINDCPNVIKALVHEWERRCQTIAWCPECDSRIELGKRAKLGAQIECPECGVLLEVIGLEPLELDYALEEEWEEKEMMSTVAWCPECDGRIELGEGARLGAQLECPECGTMLEVISLRPLELDYAVEDEEWEEEWE